jgi:ribonuclease T2
MWLCTAALAAAQERGGRPGEFDFYVLALSWSPGFCETEGRSRNSPQCEPGRRLGFVVHGLWPQYDSGFPSSCDTRNAPRYVIDETSELFPDAGLARHQWRKHGTCSGLDPSSYFRATRQARAMVKIPEPLEALGREGQTTAQNVERAFAEANPGLRPDMMAVTCRRDTLAEVRICLDKNLSGFRTCPQVDRATSCRFGPIRVTAPR